VLDNYETILVLVFAWGAYSAIHSWLASLQLKRFVARHWPNFMPAYRFIFNVLAMLLVVPPLWWTFTLPGPQLWQWEGIAW
jgi:hypothetical protein